MYKLIVLLLLGVCSHASAETIKKCQDAEGKWHYGDQAALECQLSKITEIDGSGVQVNQIDAPDTLESIESRKEIEEKLAEQARLDAEQQALDQRLLVTYENESSIIRTRDALLIAIDSSIATDEIMKERLEKEIENESNEEKGAELRSQLEEYDKSIRDRLASKELVRARYNLDLARFQELTKVED